MTDRAPFDARLADAFERYVAPAPVTVNSRAVAAAVATQRPRPATWSAARLLALAALLLVALVAAAVIGTGGQLLGRLATSSPSPLASTPTESTPIASEVPSSPVPTPAAGATAWDAVYLRRDPRDATAIQVVAVRPDGAERLLRSLPATLLGARGALSPAGLVARTGWLFVYETGFENTTDGQITLVDLADPSTPASFVTFNAPVGPRWSTTGLLAVPGYGPGPKPNYEQWSAITVLDPRSGRTTSLGSLGLFGGGPSIVWTANGSGILDAGKVKPIDGGADIAITSADVFLDRRVGAGRRTVDVCDPTLNGECTGRPGPVVRVMAPGGGEQDWYTATGLALKPTDAQFTEDGRALLVTLEMVDGATHRAVIVRMTGPDQSTELATYDLPAGGYGPSLANVSPDDLAATLVFMSGPSDAPLFTTGPILRLDGSGARQAVPTGFFAGWVPGPLAESWPGIPIATPGS